MDELLNWLRNSASSVFIIFLGGIFALLFGFIGEYLKPWIFRVAGYEEEKERTETYSEKLTRLTDSLTKASSEVDALLIELTKVASERELAVKKLETDLVRLEQYERQMQQRIKDLENVPVPVAEHFASIIRQGEKKSASRDYFLFGWGVVVSTVIAILLRLAGLG